MNDRTTVSAHIIFSVASSDWPVFLSPTVNLLCLGYEAFSRMLTPSPAVSPETENKDLRE